LETIDHSLSPIPRKEQKFITIFGLGGIGKSRVALAYAKRYESKFDVTLWVKSETRLSLIQSFTEIAVDLRIPGADRNSKGERNIELVFMHLKEHCRFNPNCDKN
jgi:thymidylate kinase